MHVLLIKMSSMGDVIHTLPALTDAMHAIPDLKIDWVIEPAFADIAAWHPAVKNIIPLPLRAWRKNFLSAILKGEIKKFIRTLRAKKYDVIIDAQGLLKSALVTTLTRGESHGYDKLSAREKIANYFYQKKYVVDQNQHAVTRSRQLLSHALHYVLPHSNPNYHIDFHKLPTLNFNLHQKYLVFLHGTTWESKHYPDSYWLALLAKTHAINLPVYVFWGNTIEKNRAEKFAASFSNVTILSHLSIAQIATVLKNATAVVGGDTGFTHLCAALSTPTISLYGPTDPVRIGAMGDNQLHLTATFPCAPCYSKTCWYARKNNSPILPTCFTSVNADIVWKQLKKLMEMQHA